jgi:hypothetical protein
MSVRQLSIVNCHTNTHPISNKSVGAICSFYNFSKSKQGIPAGMALAYMRVGFTWIAHHVPKGKNS